MGNYQELRRKVVLVTGGGGGIGRATAIRFAMEGAWVCVSDIDGLRAEQVAREIALEHRRAIAAPGDVTRDDSVREMIEKVVREFGRLDVLVHCAGVAAVSPFIETSVELWDRVMDINAKGTFIACQAAARQMIAQGQGGRIVVIASASGKRAPGKTVPMSAYVASKHAVVGLAKQIGLELADHGILVNSVCPGIVDTQMWELIDEQASKLTGSAAGSVRERVSQAIPIGRIEKAEDVANLVVFLASDDAAYITADSVNVAGGILQY